MGAAMTRVRALLAGIRESGFGAWSRQRPFLGGVLVVLAGIEMFFSGQLDIGNIHVQLGIEGFQATVIPVGMVLLGILAVLMPAHRIFYGVLALVLAVYSLIGVNLGGFFVGMLLGSVGGVLIVAWMPKAVPGEHTGVPDQQAELPAAKGALPLVPSRS
jgi:hypothetical protein